MAQFRGLKSDLIKNEGDLVGDSEGCERMSCLKGRKRRELHLDKRPDLFILVRRPQKQLSAPRGGSPDRRGRFGVPIAAPVPQADRYLWSGLSRACSKGATITPPYSSLPRCP